MAHGFWNIPPLVVCGLFIAALRDTPSRPADRTEGVAEPAAAPSLRDGALSVQITGTDGGPIDGASVRVLWMHAGIAYLAATATSDASGVATLTQLPRGSSFVLAERGGFARSSTSVVVAREDQRVALKLPPAQSLTFRVVDELGAPIASPTAQVETGDLLPFGILGDAHGWMTIERLGPPPWKVTVGGGGFEGTSQTIAAPKGEAAPPLTIVLRKLGELDVTVERAGGGGEAERGGAAGGIISWVGSGVWPARRMTLDARGHGRISGLPRGVIDLRAVLGNDVAELQGIAIERGELRTVTVKLAPGRNVSVQVRDGDETTGAGIGGGGIVLAERGLSSFPLEGRTDARGYATLGPIAREGDATLSVSAAQFVPKSLVAVPAGGDPVVRIGLLRAGTIVGDVRDSKGFPVESATLELIGTELGGQPIDDSPDLTAFRAAHFAFALGAGRTLVPSGELGVLKGKLPPVPHDLMSSPISVFSPLAPVSPVVAAASAAASAAGGAGPTLGPFAAPRPSRWLTRRDGGFRAFPVTPGQVRILVHHPDYVEGLSESITLTPGATERVRITLHGGGTLTGRLVDDRGMPVGHARIGATLTALGATRSTLTATDGTFAFAAIASDVQLSVYPPDTPDRVALRKTLKLAEAERQTVELTLPQPRPPMSISVQDERGARIVGAQVTAISLDREVPFRKTLFTDADGVAIFPGTKGLALRLELSATGRAPRVEEMTGAKEGARFVLTSGLTVEGHIWGPGGRIPVRGASVQLQTTVSLRRTMTDAEGGFRFVECPAGRAQLRIRKGGFAEVARDIEIATGGAIQIPAIELTEGGTVEGVVQDASGNPVAGAHVSVGGVPMPLAVRRPSDRIATTNTRGEFRLDDLPEGIVTLVAVASLAGSGSVAQVPVSARRRGDRVVISLAPNAALDRIDPRQGGIALTVETEVDVNADGGETAVRVREIAIGGGASLGGLLEGDFLEAIDGHPVSSVADAIALLAGGIGTDVMVRVRREDGAHTLRLVREKMAH